jgi:hypothetical protein
MKKLLFLLSLILTLHVTGQITLTNSDFSNSGDTIRLSQTTDPTIDYSTTGANQTWDYSGLVAESQILKNCVPISQAGALAQFLFGPFASPTYQGSYFAKSSSLPLDQIAQFLGLPIEAFDQVSKVSATGVTSIGNILTVSGTDIPVKSDTIEKRYQLPLTYLDNYFSRGYTNLDLNPIQNAQWIQHRSRASEVDGYGIITTPLGTFNALRVHHLILETDSLYIDFNGFGTWIPIPVPQVNEYEWWTNGQKEPLLKISTSTVMGNETVTAIEYRDIYRGMDAGISELTFSMNLFPNPTSDLLFVQSNEVWNTGVISDAQGRIMKNLTFTECIDVKELPKGTYFLSIETRIGRVTKSLVKD